MSKHPARLSEAAVPGLPPTSPKPRWESVTKAAEFYGVAPKTVREHIAAGDFRAVFFGRVLRVDLNSIDAWLRPVNGGE